MTTVDKDILDACDLTHEKITNIIGKQVQNSLRENLGKIEDLVFNTNGKISYAVMSFGGFLGMGEKFFAIPWESLNAGPDSTLVLKVDKSRLQKAPGFDKSYWPTVADMAWASEADKWFYANVKAPDRSLGGYASRLKSAIVKNSSGTMIATVEDVIVDLVAGRATLVIVHTEKAIKPEDRLVAIPWSAMTTLPKENVFTLNKGENVLREAHSFTKDKWPHLVRSFTDQVYRHFGLDLDAENPAMGPQAATGHHVAPTSGCRSTEMVGAACNTANTHEHVGVAKDLIVASDGSRIAFLVIDSPSESAKRRAIPFSLCRFTENGGFVISCEASTIRNSPSFGEKEWPDFNDTRQQESIFGHYAVKNENWFSYDR